MPGVSAVRLLDRNRMAVDHRLAGLFEELGLSTLEAVMGCEQGELLRGTATGDNVRLRLPDGRAIYLKRYRYRARRLALREALKGNFLLPSGMREWWTTRRLELEGFPVPCAAAAGEDLVAGEHRSFFCTVALEGREPADDALRARGRAPRKAVADLGRLIARFHGAGWSHQDLYLCHVFVDPAWTPVLIDHQRTLRQEGGAPERARVKDLAELAYSAEACGAAVTRTDRLRFLRAYLGEAGQEAADSGAIVPRRLGKTGRLLWKGIAKKAARIAARDLRRAARAVPRSKAGEP